MQNHRKRLSYNIFTFWTLWRHCYQYVSFRCHLFYCRYVCLPWSVGRIRHTHSLISPGDHQPNEGCPRWCVSKYKEVICLLIPTSLRVVCSHCNIATVYHVQSSSGGREQMLAHLFQPSIILKTILILVKREQRRESK